MGRRAYFLQGTSALGINWPPSRPSEARNETGLAATKSTLRSRRRTSGSSGEIFQGQCSHREIDQVAEAARKENADVVVGVGGGKTLDNGLTALPRTHHFMHGEKVNFGTLTQFALEDRTAKEIKEFVAFCLSVGLPTTLEDLDLGNAGRDDLLTAAKAATAANETIYNMPFPVTAANGC